jgi:hypothetical protein
MALSKETLQASIEGVLGNKNNSAKDFADGIFDAYETYASSAVDLSGDGPVAFPAKAASAATLLSAMTLLKSGKVASNNVANTNLSTALGTALLGFWTGVFFDTKIPATGMASEALVSVSFPGTGTASISLSPDYDNATDAATPWADVMHTYATTIKVTITGLLPNGSPAPPVTGPIT